MQDQDCSVESVPSTFNTEELLGSLGFSAAAKILTEAKVKKRKLAIAYEHHKFVSQEKIDAFNIALRVKTQRVDHQGWGATFQQLSFVPVASYAKVPPMDVLEKLKGAIGLKCFDSFEVAHIVEVKEDPLLFGRIDGCSDRFFIAQWDNDIKIEDLLKANEG